MVPCHLTLDHYPRSSEQISRDAYQRYLWNTVQILLVFFVVGIALNFIPTTYQWSIPAVLGAVVAAGLVAFQFFLNPDKFLIPRYLPVSRTSPPSTTGEQFETLLIERVKAWKKSSEGKRCERLVVFVDDLDRLSAEEMVKGLDAVRTFMEIPKIELASLGIVFIISCDEERVAEALSKGRSNDLPGTVFNRSDARRFLDRIFQFRLEIPLFPKQDLRGFALQRLRDDLPQIVEDLKVKNVPVENLVERLIHVDVQDPRNALQNLNAFAQCWWLAKQREWDGAGTTRQGGLGEGAVSNHPLSLAALCAFRVDYPDFYHDLQHTPDLLKRFEEVFTRDMSETEREAKLNEQPEAIRLLLDRYWDGDKKRVKPEYRRLRQYIASLRGLRWPASLQPLLLLSQDPATRKRGDRAPRLMEAFFSGDTQGVLAEFGRDHDANPLSPEDVRLLRDLSGDLSNETDVRRDNGAAVIAELAPRLQPGEAPSLLSPLARRLVESPRLRYRIGVPHIHSVLSKTYDDDQREVAAVLIDDLLTGTDKINFQTSTFETPTLDQATDMVREAVDIVLEVRSTKGLDATHESKLLTWLETRQINTGDKADSLNFAQFEQWSATYESSLIPAFSHRYAELVVQQLDADDLDGWDVKEALRRTKQVLENLAVSGEESRSVLWALLPRIVAVKHAEAVTLAWGIASRYCSDIPSSDFSHFVNNFAGRALNDMKREDWAYDRVSTSDALIRLAQNRGGDIDENASATLVDLAINWSIDDQTAESSVMLVKILENSSSAVLTPIWLDWSGRLLDDLPTSCIKHFAADFGEEDTDVVQQQVFTSLAVVATTTTISDEVAERFRLFMCGLSNVGVEWVLMQDYLGRLFAFIQEQYQNPEGYLTKVFPVVPHLINRGPKRQSGSLLHDLFYRAANSPSSQFDWLCAQMAEYWPVEDVSLSPYSPQQIFVLCQTSSNTWLSNPHGYGLLDSIKYMVEKGLVDKSQTAVVVGLACRIWPYHRDHALTALQELEGSPTPPMIAGLAGADMLEDAEALEDLLMAWRHISHDISEPQNLEVAHELLKAQVGVPNEPDMALRLWFDAQEENKVSWMRRALDIVGLNDTQTKRMWLQIVPNLSEVAEPDLLQLVDHVLALVTAPSTQSALLDSQDAVNARVPSKESRYSLAAQLLRCLHSSSSQAVKNRLVAWMKELMEGDDGFLKEMKHIGAFSSDDVSLLMEQFPKSRVLKTLQK